MQKARKRRSCSRSAKRRSPRISQRRRRSSHARVETGDRRTPALRAVLLPLSGARALNRSAQRIHSAPILRARVRVHRRPRRQGARARPLHRPPLIVRAPTSPREVHYEYIRTEYLSFFGFVALHWSTSRTHFSIVR